MAFRHGKYAEITVNTHALSAFADSVDLGIDVDTSSVDTFLQSWKASVVGQAGANLTMSGSYDPTATTGPAAVLTALVGADPFAVTAYPGGNVSGQVSRAFNAILKKYTEKSAVGAKVEWSCDLLVTGAITFATV